MLLDRLGLPLPIMEKKPLVAQTTRLMLTLPVLLRTPVGETKIPLPMIQPTMTLALLVIPPIHGSVYRASVEKGHLSFESHRLLSLLWLQLYLLTCITGQYGRINLF